jgi:hypothetical protein
MTAAFYQNKKISMLTREFWMFRQKMNNYLILATISMIALSSVAKNGQRGGGNGGQVLSSACDIRYIFPHENNLGTHPFFQMSCQLNKYSKTADELKINLINCVPVNDTTSPNGYDGSPIIFDGSMIALGTMQLTTFRPEIISAISLLNIGSLNSNDRILLDMGSFGSGGKGASGLAVDIHQMTIGQKAVCTTKHGMVSNRQQDLSVIPYILYAE